MTWLNNHDACSGFQDNCLKGFVKSQTYYLNTKCKQETIQENEHLKLYSGVVNAASSAPTTYYELLQMRTGSRSLDNIHNRLETKRFIPRQIRQNLSIQQDGLIPL